MASYRNTETSLPRISSKTQRSEGSDLAEKNSLSAVEKYRLLRETRRVVRRERLAEARKPEIGQDR